MITPIQSYYNNISQLNETTSSKSSSFTDLLDTITNQTNKLNQTEANMQNTLNDGTSTVDMVHSMLEAERQVQTIISYRDKIVSIIQDIAKTQI
jgi:flagellar hook-basal body complex protein FliE